MRLDNVVYRLGLAASRAQARQIVNHGLIAVNGKKVDIPSFCVKVGQTISANPTKKDKTYYKSIEQVIKNKKDFPSWLSFDAQKLEGKVLTVPTRDDMAVMLDAQVVVEYYSR
jgi:small subunit ribosomal protein S4